MNSSNEGDAVFQAIFRDHQQEFVNILLDTAMQELEWIDYLFKDGSMIGLNAKILSDYLRFITNEAAENIGLGKIIDGPKTTPLPWMKSWVTSDAVQVAPQETELSAYLVGQIDSTVDHGSLDDFSDF